MAITNSGRFAIVTAVCTASETLFNPDPLLEGLVHGYMSRVTSALEYVSEVARMQGGPRGYNVVVGDGETVAYYSDVSGVGPSQLDPGVHILSNGLLNTPWPKCERLRGRFSMCAVEAVQGSLSDTPGIPTPAPPGSHYEVCDLLLHIMCDAKQALYHPSYHSAPPSELEPFVSTVFTQPMLVPSSPRLFGTHTTIVVAIQQYGECLYAQRSVNGPFTGTLSTWDDKLYCRKDVVFMRLEDGVALVGEPTKT